MSNRMRMAPSGAPMLGANFVWNAGSVGAQNTSSQNFPLPGAEVGDCPVVAAEPTATGLQFSAQQVVIDGTVTIVCMNSTLVPLDPTGTGLAVRVL